MMTFFARCVWFALASSVVATACKSSEQPCTPESAELGDAQAMTRTVVVEGDRTQGVCRPRLEILRTTGEVKSAADEAGLGEVPAIDFSRERVVLRESQRERGVRWLVARGDGVIAGTQGCTGAPPDGCFIELFKVIPSAATVTEHACPELPCGAIPSEP